MEKAFDFFKDLKDRLSSPLLSSFLIAWIVTNWHIIVGLLFYKIQDLKVDGYSSYLNLIDKNINLNTNFLWPFGIALFYTFAFPFIKNVILAFGAWIKRWGNDWTLGISKTGMISAENYIRLRKEYGNLIKSLTEITNAESETQKQKNILIHESIEKDSQIKILKDNLEKYRSYNAPEILSGEWRYKLFEKNTNVQNSLDGQFALGDRISIQNQLFTIIKANNPGPAFNIISFVCNLHEMVLIIQNQQASSTKTVFTLRVSDNFNSLKGVDTIGNTIIMERIFPLNNTAG